MGRMRGTVEVPVGLEVRTDVVTPAEEEELIAGFAELTFAEVRMRGQVARRTVCHFGFDYDYETWQLVPTDPWPQRWQWLRDRCAAFAGLPAQSLAQALVNRYPPGATIGWHRDATAFGPTVVGVSLLSQGVLRFQRGTGERRRVFEAALPARSAYRLTGAARSSWQHSIPPVPALRYSVTFRAVRRQPNGSSRETP